MIALTAELQTVLPFGLSSRVTCLAFILQASIPSFNPATETLKK